jgi:L-fucose mutarotase
MLKYRLIHPEIIGTLAGMGHGGQVLIADSNYDVLGNTPAGSKKVFLNLAPGMLNATDVLEALLDAIPVEAAVGMYEDSGATPAVGAEFARLLPQTLDVEWVPRFDFYNRVNHPRTSLVIATGEQRLYSNLLLVLGVVANGA